MAKSTKIIAALGVAGMLGMIAMPTFAADIQNITDDITVTVTPTCTFQTKNNGVAATKSYAASHIAGEAVTFNDNGEHTFNVFCNDPDGYNVKAVATGLSDSNLSGAHSSIEFAPSTGAGAYDASAAGTAEDGKWTATVDTTGTTAAYTLTDAITTGTAQTIVNKTSAAEAAGSEFKVTYKAYVGTSTQAGTYTGTVTYTLAAN